MKELGAIWSMHPNKSPQAWKPFIDKAVKLWRSDPTRFMMAILEGAEENQEPDSISAHEIDLLERIREGRVDLAELVKK